MRRSLAQCCFSSRSRSPRRRRSLNGRRARSWGTVKDESGATLPGVIVSLKGEAIIGTLYSFS